MIRGILPHELPDVWRGIEAGVAESCRRGGGKFLASDILALLADTDMQLWLAENAFAITQIITYPQKKIARIEIGGGEDYERHFDDFLNTIETWAKAHGCNGEETVTREGYKQPFEKNGWVKKQIYMEKRF